MLFIYRWKYTAEDADRLNQKIDEKVNMIIMAK
jgi:hypothetical protein